MTYQPVTPLSGIPGWIYLTRTKSRQISSFASSSEIKRETDNFRKNIAAVATAKDLVANRQLLKVALGAFGLDDDLDKKFFIQKVLSEGTSDPKSMANRLVDKRYTGLSEAFGFGSKTGRKNAQTGFAEKIVRAYTDRQFEIAVGNNDQSLRLAMSFAREISVIAANPGAGNTGWYKVLGSPPIRKVVEQALHLPSSFSGLNIDRQLNVLKQRIESQFGSNAVTVFNDPGKVEKFVQQFLVTQNLNGQINAASGASAALTLLQQSNSSGFASNSIESIIGALY